MIVNHVPGMQQMAGTTTDCFGKDQTGSVTYTFNRQGFRSSCEFDFVPRYAFFGCSLVFGIGVEQDNTTAAQFDCTHNYGLAGTDYDNRDIAQLIEQYLKSEFYSHETQIVVVWHHHNTDFLNEFYHRCPEKNFLHFFCSDRLIYGNCYSAPKNLDFDVSGTHAGPQTHKFFARSVRALGRSI